MRPPVAPRQQQTAASGRLLVLMGALALLLACSRQVAAAPLIGADLDLPALPPEPREAALARLAESGAASVHFLLDWNRVEPTPGQFTWQADDAAVDAALAHGLQVVLVLGPCAEWAVDPAWEVPPDQRRCSLPRSLDLWRRYVRGAVRHFRGRVRYWQVRTHPTAREFRGARSEYLRLLAAAASEARAADRQSLIVLPEAGALDIAAVDRLLSSPDSQSCDILGLYLPLQRQSLTQTALPWAVLANEIIPQADPSRSLRAGASRRPPLWVLGEDEPLGGQAIPADLWIAHYLLAWAFGVERFCLPPEAIEAAWIQPLSQLQYLGFLRLGPEVWALAFQGPQGPVVAAWSLSPTDLPASALGPVSDSQLVAQSYVLGQPPGSAIVSDAGPLALRLGPRPALILGLAPELEARTGPPIRAAVLDARPGPRWSDLRLLYADYSLPNHPEFGLYNRPLRRLPGGAITEESRAGRVSLRTHMTFDEADITDDPWIYFDVDDAWLYFDRGHTRLAITVECEGSFMGEEKLGLNLRYDAADGYRFTKWQWVHPGYHWQCYRFELDDVSFANRQGYDFCLNAKGSKQNLWVSAVIVEKLPPLDFARGLP